MGTGGKRKYLCTCECPPKCIHCREDTQYQVEKMTASGCKSAPLPSHTMACSRTGNKVTMVSGMESMPGLSNVNFFFQMLS
jgi:hypothetical protein